MKLWSLICSLTAHLILILLIFIATSWFKQPRQPEIIPLELEIVEKMPVATVVQPALAPEPEPVSEPEPEPEPVSEPEPEPEPEPPSVIVPEPQETPKPPEIKPEKKPEPPKPKPVEQPKPKQPSRKERMDAARKKIKTITPPKPQPQPDKSKDVQRILAQATSRPIIAPAAVSGPVPGVSAAQRSNYESYLQRCVMPTMQNLWDTFGPNGLGENPTDVIVTFHVCSNGSVKSFIITQRSDNPQMNEAVQAVARQLSAKGFPPFSTVGLSTERNAALPITYTMRYRR